MLKAALYGAGATFVWAMVDQKVGITAKFPESIKPVVAFLPGAIAGVVAKKWG